jgi:hypothetical protein
MPDVVFEPTIPTDERQQTYSLDREPTGTGILVKTQVETATKHTKQ